MSIGEVQQVEKYSRWTRSFMPGLQVTHVVFTSPSGVALERPAYEHQPAKLEYDRYFYESVTITGPSTLAVRFTPEETGTYRYQAMNGDERVEEGRFQVVGSAHPGFIQVSKKDSRYFACSDESSFVPIGVNLSYPIRYALPASKEFYTGDRYGTMGVQEYRRWFRQLALHGGNFARLWLSVPYFEPELETAGELDLGSFARLDAVVEAARAAGIRLKLTLEHFRTFKERPFVNTSVTFMKRLKHPEQGRSPKDMDEWMTSDEWQRLWFRKVEAYTARYGDDPVVMAWELWNECNCCETSDWQIQVAWTRRTAARLQAMVPRQMVVNSIGSFSEERKQSLHDDFKMEELSFQQVHRYLDLGAELELCREDPALAAADAVRRARREDRPVILAETGAVNEHHTGPFRLYRYDDHGMLFFDTAFPPFFAGAAAPGQAWYWADYVDQKRCWRLLRPFSLLLEGIRVDEQGFVPVDGSTDRLHLFALIGKQYDLLLIRNKEDRWDKMLLQGAAPAIVQGARIRLPSGDAGAQRAVFYRAMEEQASSGYCEMEGPSLILPDFQTALFVRIVK